MLVAFVGALAGVLGAFVAGGFLVVNGNRQRAAEQSQADREARRSYRYRQLTELYGPLMLERRRSELLRARLPQDEPDGSRWRLVHHIEDAKADPDLTSIVERILIAGDEISRLLRENAGLIEQFPAPESFAKFVLHHELLRLSWATGVNQDPQGSYPFPGKRATDPITGSGDPDEDLDVAIANGVRLVEADLAAL
jgi:hypothetical protein